MAVAQHRVSKTRKRLRRSHNALDMVITTKCPECGEVIRPHRVCKACGSYKGKKVITSNESTKSE